MFLSLNLKKKITLKVKFLDMRRLSKTFKGTASYFLIHIACIKYKYDRFEIFHKNAAFISYIFYV